MKKTRKLIAAVLALLLIPALCACEELDSIRSQLPDPPKVDESPAPTEEVSEPVESEPVESEAPETPAAPDADGTQVFVSFTADTKESYDPQNGTELILTFSSVVPKVNIVGSDGAAAEKINTALGLIEETYYTGNDYGYGTATGYNMMLELAEDNYSYVVGSGLAGVSLQLSASRTVSVSRADGAVISLLYNDYEFTGGAHGNYGTRSFVFDTRTGEMLTLDSLSSDPAALKEVLLTKMQTAVEEDKDGYYSSHIDPSLDLTSALPALLREGSWDLGDNGLEIFSSLYELGPYAAGITEFTIPYSELTNVLDSKWIPAAKSGDGTLSISPIDAVDDGTVQIVGKVTLDAEGQEYCLRADGAVYDVTISSGMYSEQFYKNMDLWYANLLSDSAVQLQLTLPEGLPNLMISYRDSAGESHELFITGSEGNIQLTDPTGVQAVG